MVSRSKGHSKVELTSERYGDFGADNADQWGWMAQWATRAPVELVKPS